MRNRKLLVLGLVASLSIIPVLGVSTTEVSADTIDEISASIDDYQTQKADLLGQIDELQAQLVTTIASQQNLAAAEVELEDQMAQTEADLAEAEEDKAVQHEAMKTRIQYVYERGGNDGWVAVFLEDGDINAWLTSDEYTDNLYKYDRDQLQAYADAVTKVSALQAQQRQQKSELESKKNSLNETEAKLNELLKQAQNEYDDYDEKIAEAYGMVDAYKELVSAQNDAISELVAAQQTTADDTTVTDTASVDTTVDTTTSEAQAAINEAAQQLAAETGTDISTATQAATQAYQATGSNGTASGAALLAYAQQFLGNSYVYGGNSLTDGIDCSGFVQQVYANFGISTSRTSWDIENEGTEVSYSDVQIGDVVCYEGHVGIYAGNGQIINAANEEQGITYTNADYDTITSVRRFLSDDSSTESTETVSSTSEG